MSLTGAPLLLGSVGLALLLPVLVVAGWARVRGRTAVRAGQRWAGVLACQLAAVVCVALLVNDQTELYASWGDLLGSHATTAVVDTSAAPPPGSTVQAPPAGSLLAGGGRLIEEHVRGTMSGVDATIRVLLPPGYADPANVPRRYPVMELFPGYPGTPATWLHALNLASVLRTETAAGRIAPAIVVLAPINVAAPRDTECADVVPGGPRVETFLTRDVHDLVLGQFRADPSPQAWGLMGYSTGGFCAAKLALRHPTLYRSAVVLEGYFTAVETRRSGILYGGSQLLRDQSSPIWLAKHRPAPIALLAMTTKQDADSYLPTLAFVRVVRPPVRVSTITLPQGGHNTQVWSAVLPACLHWLSAQLQPGA